MIKKINNWLRKSTLWMESFSRTRYALWALFGFAFVEASFFPIPPDVLLIAIALAYPKRSFVAAFWCTLGSSLGGAFGYLIGHYLMELIGIKIINFYHFEATWAKVVATFQSDVGYWFLAGAAFTPIPYKVATIAAGATNQALIPFFIISTLGRGLRFFLVGSLFFFFGPTVKSFIDKYFEKLTLAFILFLFCGFFVLKYLL